MIDRETYEANKDRPAWVRRHRDELQQLTGLEIPRSLPDVEAWLEGHQSHMTQRMREHYDETDSAETDDGGDE